MWRRCRGPALLAGLCLVATAAAGCGSEDHPNEPRPASPIEVTARVDQERVTVAPNSFGAGLVNLTISNQSDQTVELTVEGQQLQAASNPIQPNAVGVFKVDFEEGEYQVTAGSQSTAQPQVLRVGPERPSSQNQVLLP
jgi:hypothetical protein